MTVDLTVSIAENAYRLWKGNAYTKESDQSAIANCLYKRITDEGGVIGTLCSLFKPLSKLWIQWKVGKALSAHKYDLWSEGKRQSPLFSSHENSIVPSPFFRGNYGKAIKGQNPQSVEEIGAIWEKAVAMPCPKEDLQRHHPFNPEGLNLFNPLRDLST